MRAFLLFLVLLLAGCTPGEEGQAGNQVSRSRDEPLAAPRQTPAAEPEQEGAAPPGAFQWTGRYAATRELCTGGLWEFTNARVRTDGETSCDIGDVREGGGRVELTLACTAEGMKTNEDWTLTRRDEGIAVSRSTGRETIDVELIRCD